MSLSLLVHSQAPVAIVRWFLESKGLVVFATGPVVQIPLQEFRATGYDWIRRHFQEYLKVRLSEDKFIKVFQPGEAAKFMKKRRVLEIHLDPSGNFIFSRMVVENYSLTDLTRVKPISERNIASSSSPEVFWKTFDEVLATAPEAE